MHMFGGGLLKEHFSKTFVKIPAEIAINMRHRLTIYSQFLDIHNSSLDIQIIYFVISQNNYGYPKLFLDIQKSIVGYP